MAIGSLGSLVVSMALDTARFEGDLGRAAAIAERRARHISRTFDTLAKAIGTGLFARFIANAAATGDQMLAMAERTGRTVESLSQLEFVAKRGNTSIEALLQSQDQLAKNLGATDDQGKKAVRALDELGLTADRIRALSPDRKLEAIADAMGRIEDPAKRARLEMALFGQAGTELDQVLRSGSGGIRALREESDRFGATVTELEARRLARLDEQIKNTSAQFNRLKLEIAGIVSLGLAPYLELVNKGLVGWRAALGLTGDEMEELNNRAEQLVRLQQTLRDQQKAGDTTAGTKQRLADIREEMGLIKEKQEFLFDEVSARARFEARTADLRGKAAAASEAAAKRLEEEAEAAEKAAEAYAKWRAELTEIVEFETMLNRLELKFPTAILDDAALERELGRTSDIIIKGAEGTQKTLDALYKHNADAFGSRLGEMTIFADQAARNIQSTFADFLFDPFDKGLKGMLVGFVDVLRRMVAEIAAAELLGQGSQGGGILGSILGGIGSFLGGKGFGAGARLPGAIDISRPLPTLAEGGFLRPGQVGIVGERRAEFVRAGRTGATVTPMEAARPIVVNQTINVQAGASTQGLAAFAARIEEQAVERIGGLIRGGAYAG